MLRSHRPNRLLILVWVACAQACAQPARPALASGSATPCTGNVVVRDRAELLAAAQCPAIRGQLTVTGGALIQVRALGALRASAGSIHIGPTLTLSSIDGLSGLDTVYGSLVIDSNLSADGVYLPALHRVAGALTISANTAITGVSAPVLEYIGGDLTISANPSLARIDLANLRSITGTLELSQNIVLDDVVLPRLERVGSLIIDRNPALAESVIRALRARLD